MAPGIARSLRFLAGAFFSGRRGDRAIVSAGELWPTARGIQPSEAFPAGLAFS